MNRASIAIFGQKEIDDSSQHESRPYVPDDIFEAAKRVINNKNTEMVKTRTGMYVVSYSETGPFQKGAGAGDWLPVYVARVRKWDSGGITKKEMDAYENHGDA